MKLESDSVVSMSRKSRYANCVLRGERDKNTDLRQKRKGIFELHKKCTEYERRSDFV